MQAPGGEDGRRYRIVRRLGHGGMAEVFEAMLSGTHGFSRRVAIKRITTRAADDPELAERFLDEARIASQLHHAGIVGILDYGFVDGLPFQVLEFVDGLDADRLLDRAGSHLPPDIALIICADVAHALDHAHRACGADGQLLGIVHRDVKPANILVSWDGDVKLSDFGIALARGRIAVTEAGVARGTPFFMAPEQRTKSETGPRTDVFALGCTLHALLTGQSPQADFDTAMRVIAGEPAPLDPSLPTDVRAVIARACAPDPDQRYADCGAFADALGPLLAYRLQRDARGRMRDFLADVRRPPTGASPGGLLDQLLAVDLILAGPDARSFTLTQPVAPPPKPEPVPEPERAPEREPVSEPEPDLKPPRRRTGIVLGILLVLAAAGLGVGIALRDKTKSPTAAVPADAVPVALVSVDAPAPPADAPIVVDAAPAATPDAREPHARRPDASRADRPDAEDKATPARGEGFVTVSGKGLVRAEVVIDNGKWREYVPNPVGPIPIGKHKIEVIKVDGTKLGPKTIEVTPYHSSGHPLRVPF